MLVDESALARDERRRDGAGLAPDRSRDLGREAIARPVDGGRDGEAEIAPNRRRLDPGQPAGDRPDRSQAAEIGVAGEIIAARPRGLRRRQEARRRGHVVARRDPVEARGR